MSVYVADPSAIWCETCDDTGWAIEEGPMPPTRAACYRPDATRSRAVPCSCRPMNPVYREKRSRLRERVQGGRT